MSLVTSSFDMTSTITAVHRLQGNVTKAAKDAVLAGGAVLASAYRAELKKHAKGIARDTKGEIRPHLSEVVTTKAYVWPNGNGVSSYTGTSGPKKQHTHLLEKGTKRRVRAGIGGKYLWVEIAMQEGRLPLIQHKGPNKGLPRRGAGISPAFHPLQKSIDATLAACRSKTEETFALKLG